jgi:hypothetical protein
MAETLTWEDELETKRGKLLLDRKIEMKGSNRATISLEQESGVLVGYSADVIANPWDDEKLKISKDGVVKEQTMGPKKNRESNIVDLNAKPLEVEFSDNERNYKATAFVEIDGISKENGSCHFELFDITDVEI